MPTCEQCGAHFSDWSGENKRLCPNCETLQPPPPEILPPEPAHAPVQPEIKLPPPVVTRVLIGINIAVFAAMVLATRSFVWFPVGDLVGWGADYGPYTVDGQWWRMLTSMFLHGGIIHIAVNMWALRNLGYTAELFYGRRNFFLIYMLSGLAGSVASLLHGGPPSVGASGAIFGVAGALAALVYFKKLPVDRAILRKNIGSIGTVIVVNLAIGASVPQIDNFAHVGGLLGGTVLGFFLPAWIFRVERERSSSAGMVSVGAVAIAILLGSVGARALLAPRVDVQRAEDAFSAGNSENGNALITKALQLAPKGALVHEEACVVSSEYKQATALPICQKAVGLNTKSSRANYELGKTYMSHGQFEQALPYLQKAVSLNPDDPDAQKALQIAQAALKQ